MIKAASTRFALFFGAYVQLALSLLLCKTRKDNLDEGFAIA